jgi:hypothetical protein
MHARLRITLGPVNRNFLTKNMEHLMRVDVYSFRSLLTEQRR